jgi:Flp pilus assembly protein TadG
MSKMFRCSAGSVAVSTALVMSVLFGSIGVGVEVSHWYQLRRSMQGAADTAAVSAAWALPAGGPCGATCINQAKAVAAMNGWQDGVNGVSVDVISPPVSPSRFAGNANAVEVKITQQQSLMFSRILTVVAPNATIAAPNVGAFGVALIGTTTATTSTNGTDCVLTLANAANAILVRGNGDLRANCGIAADGGIDQNVGGTPLGSITFSGANSIIHVGTAAQKGLVVAASSTPCPGSHCDLFTPANTAMTGANISLSTATPDPYSGLSFTIPSENCVAWTGVPVAGTVYCSINLNGSGANFPAGTYYIRGGDANCVGFCVSGNNTTVTSATAGVTFVLTNGVGTGRFGANTYARVNIASGDITLNAPGADAAAGTCTGSCVLFFQDRHATETTSLDSSGTPSPFGASAVAISVAGSGYTNGTRTFTVVGGTGTAATFTATVAGGAVTAILSITNPGAYTVVPGNPVSVTVDTGGGTGARFNLTTTPITLNSFAGNGTRTMAGLLYFSKQTVSLQGNGAVRGCTGIVSKYLDVAGTPEFSNGCLPGTGIGGTTTTTTITTPPTLSE